MANSTGTYPPPPPPSTALRISQLPPAEEEKRVVRFDPRGPDPNAPSFSSFSRRSGMLASVPPQTAVAPSLSRAPSLAPTPFASSRSPPSVASSLLPPLVSPLVDSSERGDASSLASSRSLFPRASLLSAPPLVDSSEGGNSFLALRDSFLASQRAFLASQHSFFALQRVVLGEASPLPADPSLSPPPSATRPLYPYNEISPPCLAGEQHGRGIPASGHEGGSCVAPILGKAELESGTAGIVSSSPFSAGSAPSPAPALSSREEEDFEASISANIRRIKEANQLARQAVSLLPSGTVDRSMPFSLPPVGMAIVGKVRLPVTDVDPPPVDSSLPGDSHSVDLSLVSLPPLGKDEPPSVKPPPPDPLPSTSLVSTPLHGEDEHVFVDSLSLVSSPHPSWGDVDSPYLDPPLSPSPSTSLIPFPSHEGDKPVRSATKLNGTRKKAAEVQKGSLGCEAIGATPHPAGVGWMETKMDERPAAPVGG